MRSINFCYIASFLFFQPKRAPCSSVLFFLLDLQIDHLVNFFRAVAEKSLEITDETIDVSLTGRFQNDILVVVIPGIVAKKIPLSFI